MEPRAPESPTAGGGEPARPFEPAPRKGPAGCAKPLWIGCGALLLLLGIGAIVFVVKSKDILAWGMERIETEVMAALPSDVTAEERGRLERGFDAALEAVGRGEVEPPALNALQKQLVNAAEKASSRELSRDDALDLLSALERVAGLLPGEEEPDPVGAAAEPGP